MPLTDTAIRSAKLEGDKPKKLTDGKGLYLILRKDGARWWRFDYVRPIIKTRNTLSFGVYPDVGLKEAREQRDAARKLLASGIDPGEHRKAERAAGAERATNSFEVVSREWLAKQSWVPAYRTKVEGWFEKNVFPWIGSRPISDLSPLDFLGVARRVEARGAIESAHRILQNCSGVMRYAVATGRAERDPVGDLRGALASPQAKHHAAITDPQELGGLLRAIDGYTGAFVTKCALRLAPLVFVRPGELRQAEWSEIDLDKAEWNIPAEKMKMRQPHLVPLAPQAVAILRELQPLTGRGQYVFPSLRSAKRPMSDNTLSAALRRLGYDGDTMTVHGFRATARTLLDEVLQFRPDYIEHQLAHAVKDPNGRAYNRTSFLSERRRMMVAWADYLDDLRSMRSNVIPISRASLA